MRNWTWIVLLGLFIIEGTLIPWVVPEPLQPVIVVSPHLVFIFVLFLGLYVHRYSALIYGLAFGMLQDMIYYGHMLGVHSFSMGLLGYLAGLAARRGNSGILYGAFVVFMGNMAYEWTVYGLNRLFNVTHLEAGWTFAHYMLPSIVINVLLAALMAAPLRSLLQRKKPVRENEED